MATFVPNVTDLYPEPALYKPDFSFLDTMLRRRQAMYNQGFSEISSKYSALAKNLTNPYNSQVRNQFLTEAQNQLKNLSAMDLSQQQNVQMAANVFTPLYKDSNVMNDLALTSHWDQQEKIAESLRLKDGGKEFSQANLEYVRMQKEAFAQDRPENFGIYAANKRYYSPYKDYSAKYQEAYKTFKPSVEEVEYVDGAYIRSEKNASVIAAEFKRHLESMLTPEEKRQIEIEGVVKYGRTPEILLATYGDKAKSEIGAYDKQIERYNKQLGLAKTDEERARAQEYIDYYKDKKNILTDNFNKLSSMDPVSLNAVKDRIAGDLYYTETVDAFSKAAERKDTKTGVQANSVWTTIYSNQQQWARQKDQQNFDWAKMLKEDELKKAGASITGGALTGNNVVLKTSEVSEYGIKGVENDIIQAKEQISAADQLLVSRLVTTGQNSDPATVKAFIDKYATLQNNIEPVMQNNKLVGYRYRDTKKMLEPAVVSDLQAFQQWQGSVAPHQMKLTALENAKKQLNNEVKKQAGSTYDELEKKISAINGGKDLVFTSNGKTVKLTNKELFDGILSGAVSFNSKGGGSTFTGPGMNGYNPGTEYINVNGIEVALTNDNPAILNAVKNVRSLFKSTEYKAVEKIRQGVYESDVINNNSLALFDANSPYFKDKQGEIDQIFGKNMSIRGVDLLAGNLAVSAPDKASTQEVLNRTRGRADVVYDEANDLFYVKGLRGLNILSNFSADQQAVYQAAVTPIKGKKMGQGVYLLESPPFKIANLPYDFQWKRITREYPGVDGTKSVNYEYFLYDGNNQQTPLLGNMTDALQLISQIGNLGENPGKTVQLVESLK